MNSGAVAVQGQTIVYEAVPRSALARRSRMFDCPQHSDVLRYRVTPTGDILVIRARHSREKHDPRRTEDRLAPQRANV